ncbi:helix-turn-helix domain-containing protein [Xanthobacter tagetidis]|uniref:Helix-turn-helix domain-containing protein n=1 Tax=Xanthobacter tagetidis TaxID=60216 RepID=A0A3L7A310_9HYPH|nr:helix-turn-helix domain-containing protein [Xanthobacter tagetidis]MBB6307149.1 putative transcriptional regulator [Xanthobacter tagetidis]RLP73991.1 helix-turn-helix domain-containing protein [Xanthobacter tagetidis]
MAAFGRDLIESTNEALAIAKGEAMPARAFVPADIDAKGNRKRLGLSQAAFAARFGFSAGAVRDWEQARKRPDPSTRVLLKVIEREPEAVERALSAG